MVIDDENQLEINKELMIKRRWCKGTDKLSMDGEGRVIGNLLGRVWVGLV